MITRITSSVSDNGTQSNEDNERLVENDEYRLSPLISNYGTPLEFENI